MSDVWPMNSLSRDEVRAIIQETLAEQTHQQSSDATIMHTIATILTSFGIEDDDRKEIRADFQHLRRWRKSVEQAQSYTFKTVITIIATGLIGALWLGIKALVGK
jgi:hypothetical protein